MCKQWMCVNAPNSRHLASLQAFSNLIGAARFFLHCVTIAFKMQIQFK